MYINNSWPKSKKQLLFSTKPFAFNGDLCSKNDNQKKKLRTIRSLDVIRVTIAFCVLLVGCDYNSEYEYEANQQIIGNDRAQGDNVVKTQVNEGNKEVLERLEQLKQNHAEELASNEQLQRKTLAEKEDDLGRIKEEVQKQKKLNETLSSERDRQRENNILAVRVERANLVRIAIVNAKETDTFFETNLYKTLVKRYLSNGESKIKDVELVDLLTQLEQIEAEMLIAALNVVSRYKGSDTPYSLSQLLAAKVMTPEEALTNNQPNHKAHLTDESNPVPPASNLGKTLWSFTAEAIHNCAVDENGTVYITGHQREYEYTPVTAIDGNNGKQLWAFDTRLQKKDVEFGQPLIGPNNNLFFSLTITVDHEKKIDFEKANFADLGKPLSIPSILFCIDTSTGKEKWRQELTGYVRTSMDRKHNTLYVHGELVGLMAVNPANGKLKWKTNNHGNVFIEGFDKNGNILAIDDSGLISLDRQNGQVKWRFATSHKVGIRDLAISENGFVFITMGNHGTSAIELQTGNTIWKTSVDGNYVNMLNEESLIISSESGFHILDATRGKIISEFSTPIPVSSISIGPSDTVYYDLRHSIHSVNLNDLRIIFENGKEKSVPVEKWGLSFGEDTFIYELEYFKNGYILAITSNGDFNSISKITAQPMIIRNQ
jgi:outer membrane protein assembly factor BamB